MLRSIGDLGGSVRKIISRSPVREIDSLSCDVATVILDWMLVALSAESRISVCLAAVVGHARTRCESCGGAHVQVALSS